MSKDKKLVQPKTFTNPLCAEVGAEFFYMPDRDEKNEDMDSIADYRYGKSICTKCEHIVDCAEWGIYNEIYGLWGGLTPRERRDIRSRRRITLLDSE